MDIINNEKKYPTLVEVVNNLENPTKTVVLNLPLTGAGNAVSVALVGNAASIGYVTRPSSGNFNITFDNILLLQSDGTFVPIPLCAFFSNITTTNLNNALSSYKTAYSTLVSGVTAATLHYSKMASNGVITSEVYNLKD